MSMLIILVALCFCCCQSDTSFNNNVVEILTNLNVSNIYLPGTKQYSTSLTFENALCQNRNIILSILPVSYVDIQLAILTARILKLQISVRAGGHGYNCLHLSNNSILIDMRSMNSFTINESNLTIHVDTGLTWKQILKHLKRKCLIAVHGQCTGVGIAGFTLHGGVHFGALSELYGLSSDNLLGAKIILGDGSFVDIIQHKNNSLLKCQVIPPPLEALLRINISNHIYTNFTEYHDHTNYDDMFCTRLFKGLKGAGSLFGIVINLSIQIYPSHQNKSILELETIDQNSSLLELKKPTTTTTTICTTKIIQSSLVILSVNLQNPIQAAQYIYNFYKYFPSEVSVTLFGLDSFYKAYLFLLKFATNHDKLILIKNLFNIVSNLRNRNKRNSPMIHFVVELSWSIIYTNITIENLSCQFNQNQILIDNNNNSNSQVAFISSPWISTIDTWSVESYNLVWGKKHIYGGASLAVGASKPTCANIYDTKDCYGDIALLVNIMDRYKDYKTNSYGICSDCVVVLHKIGDGIRNNRSSNQGSFHTYRLNSTLWTEIDCGLFHRHKLQGEITTLVNNIIFHKILNKSQYYNWEKCEEWLGNTQISLESASEIGKRFHYRNVPNKYSACDSIIDSCKSFNYTKWIEMHYSEEIYIELIALSIQVDPDRLFGSSIFTHETQLKHSLCYRK